MGRHPAGILLMVDGDPVDLDDLSWYLRAPCGCYAGVHLAWSPPQGKHPGTAYTTADEAFKVMHSSAAEAKRERERGMTIEIGRRDQVSERMGTANSCPHSPVWGIEPPPKPDGMTWASTYREKTLHLIPTEYVRTDEDEEMSWESVTSLCKRKTASGWGSRWHDTEGKVECKGCIKAADHPRLM